MTTKIENGNLLRLYDIFLMGIHDNIVSALIQRDEFSQLSTDQKAAYFLGRGKTGFLNYKEFKRYYEKEFKGMYDGIN